MRRGFARVPIVETAVLVLALAAIVTLTLLGSQREQSAGSSYSTYDSSGGGLQAWYELLAREDTKVSRFEERHAFLEHDVAVLIAADQPFAPSTPLDVGRPDAAALAAWVREGGRLLLAGQGAFSLLAAKDLQLRTTLHPAQPARYAATTVAPALQRFGVRSVWADGPERLALHENDRALLRDGLGAIAVRYALGRGQVVQVSDAAMFRNVDIGKPDRPRLAYALVALLGAGPRAQVAFDEALHGYVTPEHWWQVLPRRFVVAVVLALFVLGIALIGAATRLGPPRAAEPPRAPNSAEYLDALATLMERGHAAQASVAQAYASTRRLITARVGAADEPSASRIAARIEQADLREAFLDLDALASGPMPTNAQLVRSLLLAHRLREEYGTNVRGR